MILFVLLQNLFFPLAFIYQYMFSYKGTDEERGITAWKNPGEKGHSSPFIEGEEVYEPLIPEFLKRQRWLRFFPVFPKYNRASLKVNGTSNPGFDDIKGENYSCNTNVLDETNEENGSANTNV